MRGPQGRVQTRRRHNRPNRQFPTRRRRAGNPPPETAIGGFRYTPRAGTNVGGRIKDYRIYIGDTLAMPKN